MASFNPDDYNGPRRTSGRNLGKPQPEYCTKPVKTHDEVNVQVLATTKKVKRKRSIGGDESECTERISKSPRSIPSTKRATTSQKGKTTSQGTNGIVQTPAKRPIRHESTILTPPETPAETAECTTSAVSLPNEAIAQLATPESLQHRWNSETLDEHEEETSPSIREDGYVNRVHEQLTPATANYSERQSHVSSTQDDSAISSSVTSNELSEAPTNISTLRGHVDMVTRAQRTRKPVEKYGALRETPLQDALVGSETDREQSYEDDRHAVIATKANFDRQKRHLQTAQKSSKVPYQDTIKGRRSPELIVRLPVIAKAETQRRKSAGRLTTTLPACDHSPDDYTIFDKGIDPGLIQLSLKLAQREVVETKPLPRGEPAVWADSRQALCETVPYFQMPQSGCHQNDRHVYAFLFDGVGHCREYMDSDVIIARAGGSMETDSTTGKMVQKQDHRMSEAQVQSVINDIQLQNPIVIICGNKNEGAICKMPHRYNVLGWYKPVLVWAEKSRGKKRAWTTIKYRFERLNDREAPWHAAVPNISITDEERLVAGSLVWQTCGHCHNEHPTIYLVSWMCLSPECERFWKLPGGEDAGYGKLHYNPAFLLQRTAWEREEEPYSVRPPLPSVGEVVGDNLTYINTRGICCPQCGRCSSRRLFAGWRCDNTDCTFESLSRHIPVKVPMLHLPWESTGDGPALGRNKHEMSKGVKVKVRYLHGFKVYTYTFGGINGSLVHAASNAAINRQSGGADKMFEAIQDQSNPEMDMHLERRRFTGSAKTGAARRPSIEQSSTFAQEAKPPVEPTLIDSAAGAKKGEAELEDGDFMTAFSMNYGMPYKFVASGASMSFAQAPWPVRACRADLNWASQTFLDPLGHIDLNEELIFAYLQGQKIEYHDDGESGLGPRIATISLGGKAKMHLRMKMKHYVGCSKTGILTAERPVPGGIEGAKMDTKRRSAWEELQALRHSNKSLYERRRKELPRELGVYGYRTKKAPDLVSITLRHGDIVLMEGHEIQQYLEHKVVPEGPLRFALTCRTVLPEHLTPEEQPDYGIEADDESMSSLRRMAAQMVQQQQQHESDARVGQVDVQEGGSAGVNTDKIAEGAVI